jgi:hypothetical protein
MPIKIEFLKKGGNYYLKNTTSSGKVFERRVPFATAQNLRNKFLLRDLDKKRII